MSQQRRQALHACMRSTAKAAVTAFRLMESTHESVAEKEKELEDVTRFDLLSIRKDQEQYPVEHIKIADLNLTQGGVLRKDRRIKGSQYLVEGLSKGATRHLLLPVGRFHSIWQPLIGALVLYTAVMTPIVLCFDGVPSTLPVGMAAFDVVTDLIFLADVRPRPAPHRRSLPLLARR